MSDTISFMHNAAGTQMMGSLAHILAKGQAHAAAREIDEANFLNMRLSPDMFNLTKQVQTATELAGRGTARLSGSDIPSFDDNETTFAELIARTQGVLAAVQAADYAALNADPMSIVTLETPRGNLEFPKQLYLSNFLLPNIYFHTSMAYAILRHGGVELGKLDFLAAGHMPGG